MPPSEKTEFDPSQIRVLSEQVRALRERMAEVYQDHQRDSDRQVAEHQQLNAVDAGLRTDVEVLKKDARECRKTAEANRELIMKLLWAIGATALTAVGSLIAALWQTIR